MAFNQAQVQTRQSQAPQGQKDYFDLHVNGVGYLNRVRWVTVNNGNRKSKPFLCCAISALHGFKDEVSYTFFDVKVSGADAVDLIEGLKSVVEARHKVLVSFKIGDIYPWMYERRVRDENGNETGNMETACLIKGRLVLINSIKVDGQVVYRRPRAEGDSQEESRQDAEQHVAQSSQSAPPAEKERRQFVRQVMSEIEDVGTALEEDIAF